jgi:hypothetical protein
MRPSEVVALRLKAAHETVLDATVTAFDHVGTWSDDELLGGGGNVGSAEAEESKEVLGHKLSAEFEIKFRAWRNHPPKVNWSKVDPNVSIRDPSAPDMLEVMGMNISSLYMRLEDRRGHRRFRPPTRYVIMR